MSKYQVGDLVRVSGRTHPRGFMHGLPQGSVCQVLGYNSLGNLELRHPSRPGLAQGVGPQCVKLAKQAMKKRDLYAARR